MDARHFKYGLIRYSIATGGLFLVALGIAFCIVANLGTSPLSCPAYVLNGIGGLTVGNWTILTNMLYILVQIAVLRKNFKLKYLMQIPASVVFGYLIDFSVFICSWMHPVSFASKLGIVVLACLVTALGISIEVIAQAWMLSAEMTVYAFAKTIHKPFGNIKIVMDVIVLLVASLIAFLLFGNPFGFGEFRGLADILTGDSEGVVIGIGTLISALLAGALMKYTDPVADAFMDRVIFRLTGMPVPDGRHT